LLTNSSSGVNVIVYYSSVILEATKGTTRLQTLLVSMGFGLINFCFAVPAFYTIDKWGRRSLLLLTFPFLALCHLLTAIAPMGPSTGKSSPSTTDQTTNIPVTPQWPLAIVGMYLFGVFYSFSEGPVPFVYASESMPFYIRDLGMGLVTSINWLFNFLIALTLPGFFQTYRPFGAFLWYSVWCVILWFMIFW
jgi:MFS family permease